MHSHNALHRRRLCGGQYIEALSSWGLWGYAYILIIEAIWEQGLTGAHSEIYLNSSRTEHRLLWLYTTKQPTTLKHPRWLNISMVPNTNLRHANYSFRLFFDIVWMCCTHQKLFLKMYDNCVWEGCKSDQYEVAHKLRAKEQLLSCFI